LGKYPRAFKLHDVCILLPNDSGKVNVCFCREESKHSKTLIVMLVERCMCLFIRLFCGLGIFSAEGVAQVVVEHLASKRH
jgi:hypothetical protein